MIFFYKFREKAQLAGIGVPIEAGIMPVTSKSQIERMVTMCGATLPRKFQRILAKYVLGPKPCGMQVSRSLSTRSLTFWGMGWTASTSM